MDVRNCRNCGKLFNYISGPFVCPGCRDALEAKFQEVKKYIYEHPGVNISDVSEACDVETSQVRQWVREERLEFTEGSLELACEKCGTAITSGRFCPKCKSSMINDLSSAYGQPAPGQPDRKLDRDGNPKMRFL